MSADDEVLAPVIQLGAMWHSAACECPEHSEYLFADVDGWHCQNCNRLVPRNATNHPEGSANE